MKLYCSVSGIIATPLVALLAAAVPGRAVDYGIEGAPLMVNRLLNPAHYSFYIKTGLWNVPTPNYFQSHPISDFLPLSIRGKGGNTPLHVATHPDEDWLLSGAGIKILIESAGGPTIGMDPTLTNDAGDTALHHAARHKETNIGSVKSLLAGGAEANARNNEGETALHDIVRNKSPGH